MLFFVRISIFDNISEECHLKLFGNDLIVIAERLTNWLAQERYSTYACWFLGHSSNFFMKILTLSFSPNLKFETIRKNFLKKCY